MPLAPSAARTVPPAAAPLLDHAVRTDPDPLEANLSGPSPATLRVVISNSGNVAVRCTSIVIELPVGSRPRDLASTGVGIEASTTTPGWVRTGQTVSHTQARFEFEPSTDEAAVITEDPLTFKVDCVPVNSAVGVAYPLITETSAIRQDTPEPRAGHARLPKFPAGTTATLPVGTNLRVYAGEQPIEGRPPAVRVPHGSKVTVAWNPARDVVRHLHYEDQETGTPIDESKPPKLVCGPLYRETTFTLQTVSQVGGQTVSRYDSFTLQVDVPEYPRVTLPNGSLGHVDPPGLQITSPVRTEKPLTVKEAMHGKNTASITGSLEAPTVKAATTQFSGKLEVVGTFTAGNLTAASVTTTLGLTASGRVNILKAGRTPLPASGSQTFPTDGLILVNAMDGGGAPWVTTPTHTFKNESWAGVGTLIAPVKAEQEITWGGGGPGDTFSWYPFGI
ncbi:hypothetical protein OG535_29335 [Kitasatospora sp. NBC_00085]|uniref:hypothetical protein n=1 Tax=unclassified Kitasatospora TaxID=2633591 RepID=UPI003245E1A2